MEVLYNTIYRRTFIINREISLSLSPSTTLIGCSVDAQAYVSTRTYARTFTISVRCDHAAGHCAVPCAAVRGTEDGEEGVKGVRVAVAAAAAAAAVAGRKAYLHSTSRTPEHGRTHARTARTFASRSPEEARGEWREGAKASERTSAGQPPALPSTAPISAHHK